MDRLFELLLLDALASAAREEEDRPDNFFVLPPNNNHVWQDVFKKCTEENMVVGVEFTTADQSQKPIRAAILRLARQFNRQAIFLRAPIGPLSTHDQLRRELGGVQYTPSFLIVSFLEDRGEIRRYEGSLEVRAAFETGKLRRDFEECLERRARIRVAEDLAERLASGLAAAVQARRKEEEERARETAEQRRVREAREQARRLEQEKERQKEEEERKRQEEQREIDEARRAAVEERRRRRPEYVAQLLAMDLNKAPIRDIKDIMKKLELNPAGLPERKDLISELKRGVPELRMKLDNPSSTPVGITQQPPPSPSSFSEDFTNMDHDLLQGVARRIKNIDLQRAELHELKSLLAQAQLRVKNYPDRNSMVQALRRVVDAAQRTRNQSSYFGTVYQSNNLSADDTDIAKIERRAEMAEKNVEKLEDVRSKLDARVGELQRQLIEKEQKIESLTSKVRTLEIRASNAERTGREVPPKPTPRQRTSSGDQNTVTSSREKALEQTLRDTRVLFSSTKEDFNFISLLDQSEEGVVVKAKCKREELTDMNKTYALKILTNFYQEIATVTKAREEFKNEYEVLSQLLPHPNILQLHAFFYDRMDPSLLPGIKNPTRSISLFMVMDYHTLDMEENIKDLFAHQGPKSNSVLKWFAQLLSALAYLDSCHIAHCDLKLKNILLSKEDNLKVCDFGSAMKLPANMTMIFQRGMKIPGNKPHQSPELRNLRANQVINYSRADVWAAGVLAFEMCGHANPFNTLDVLGYTENQLPQLMYTRCKGSLQAFPLPTGFTTLVSSLLMYDWRRRPAAKDAFSSAQALTC